MNDIVNIRLSKDANDIAEREPFNFGILFNYSLSQPYRSADTSRSYAPGGA